MGRAGTPLLGFPATIAVSLTPHIYIVALVSELIWPREWQTAMLDALDELKPVTV